MTLLVGVDLGTTGTRAVLYRPDGTALAQAASDTPLHRHGSGHVEQDPEDFVTAALDAIGQCVAQVEGARTGVAALAVSGQMAGVLGLGGRGRASTPYDSWLDTRCNQDLEDLRRHHADELTSISGCPPMVNHAPKLRWWARTQPGAFANTEKWVVPGGFVAGRLAGLEPEDAFMDHTYLHFTGMADARDTAWSDQLTEALGVHERQRPRIVSPTTVVGALTGEAAQACGLAAGTPIAAGLGDTAAATLGAGVVRPGQLLDVAGTATILAASTDRFAPDAAARTLIAMHGAVDGQWVWLSYFSGGSLLPWLAGAMGIEEGEGAFDSLVADAATAAAGCDGLVFVPHLDGRLLPSDPSMTGSWMGLGRSHGRPELVRSVLESVAYEYAGYMAAVHELEPGFRAGELRAVGGGARSPLWNDIKASVLGIPLGTLGRDELSCWGAALVAGGAVGVFDDLGAAAERATRIAAEHQPDPADHETYGTYLPVYRDALGAASRAGRRLAGLTRPQEVSA